MSNPLLQSHDYRDAVDTLVHLDWRKDRLDPSGRWWFAYGCPARTLEFLERWGGRLMTGQWVYYLPSTAQSVLKGTVRRISLDDFQNSKFSKTKQRKLVGQEASSS